MLSHSTQKCFDVWPFGWLQCISSHPFGCTVSFINCMWCSIRKNWKIKYVACYECISDVSKLNLWTPARVRFQRLYLLCFFGLVFVVVIVVVVYDSSFQCYVINYLIDVDVSPRLQLISFVYPAENGHWLIQFAPYGKLLNQINVSILLVCCRFREFTYSHHPPSLFIDSISIYLNTLLVSENFGPMKMHKYRKILIDKWA